MSAFFRRSKPPAPRPPPVPAPPPGVPDTPLGDSTQTMYVSGNQRRDTDRIRLLVESLRDVSSAADPDALLVSMVDRAIRLVEAERGLLFTRSRDGEPKLRVGRTASGKDLPAGAAYSRHVLDGVFSGGPAVCERLGDEGGFDPSRSMIDMNLRAVMCVPLMAQDERLGVLYVDTRASTRSFTRADLRYFEAFADMLAIVWNNRRMMEQRLTAERMSKDLEVARSIQRRTLPERPLVLEGYAMCGRVLPAEETGGDYFDFFVTRDGKVAMAVGDVSGHGVPAALVMAAARAYLRGFCQSSSSPGTILRRVNRALAGDSPDDMFMSMFLCVLDPRTREFSYANAGHTRPVLLHSDDLRTEDYRNTGVALGIEMETEYEERGPFRLGAGDAVVMFSDGLTELRRGDEQYGRPRVVESIRRHGRGSAEALLEGIFRDALDWAQGDDLHPDDVTVAVLRADH